MAGARTQRGFRALKHVLLGAMGVTPIAVGCSSDDEGALPFRCESPEADEATGLVLCRQQGQGVRHRVDAKTCDPALYDPDASQPQVSGTKCLKNSDCAERPWGLCTRLLASAHDNCVYGCITNADCDGGQTCLCLGAGPGRCVEAGCETDEDCDDGNLCLLLTKDGDGFCETRQVLRCGPECQQDSDCDSGHCRSYACVSGGVCGRPFLIQGAARVAGNAHRDDWRDATTLDAEDLASDVRAALAAHWTEMGLMEHASIAAFARFTLQLLAAGAPSDLVAHSNQALADETAHARLCFAIASAYAGRDIGPGPLPLDGALNDQNFVEVVRTAFLEACVGETGAALDAAEAAEHATDPFIAASLRRIADDESRHAALGWRFVQWALGTMSESTRAALIDEFHRAVAVDGAVSGPTQPDLTIHGVLSGAARAALRRSALAEVVSPCLVALRRSVHFADGDRLGREAHPDTSHVKVVPVHPLG